MPRKTAAKTIGEAIVTEPVTEPFSPEYLDELLDLYAVPVAHEAVRRALPGRVEHHIRRLLSSDKPDDRAELLALMQGAKMSICFAVYHSVLSYARETREAAETRLNGSDQGVLPSASSSETEAA